MSEEELVVDEEFRAEDAEEDNAGDDVGYVFVKSVGRRYLTCPLFKEHEQESDECHEERIELREPRNDYRGESVSAAVFVAMVCLFPATMMKPQSPHIAPERIRVRIVTFFTLIPAYFAVFSLSPTTEIS